MRYYARPSSLFAIQEFIISATYVHETQKLLKPSVLLKDKNYQQVMRRLIYVNLLIIFLDVTLLAMQFANLYYIQGNYKGCVYAVKLRVEFAILGQLLVTVQGSSHNLHTIDTGADCSWRGKVDDTPLDTIISGSQKTRTQIKTSTTGCSAFAATDDFLASPPSVNDIVQTTGISIHSANLNSTRQESVELPDDVDDIQHAPPTPRRAKVLRSPASSELEFAKAVS